MKVKQTFVKLFLGKVGNIDHRVTAECLVESGSSQLEGNVFSVGAGLGTEWTQQV
jgi:hypothetical protein